VKGYPAGTKLGGPLSATHSIMSVSVKPEHFGWPVRRPRVFTAGLNRKTMIWVGGSDPSAEFASLFHCNNKLDGSVFLNATDDQVLDEVKRRSRLRGRHIDVEASLASVDGISPHQLFPPGAVQRLSAHEKHRKTQFGLCNLPANANWFGDLEQWPKGGTSVPGQSIPCCLTHGTLYAFAQKRVVHPLELFQAHGYNTFADPTHPYHSLVTPLLQTLSSNELDTLVGNGWHLPTMASWILYVLSNTVRVKWEMSLHPERHLRSNVSDEFCDEDPPDSSHNQQEPSAASGAQ
jgi:hypothetical protein